MHISSKNYIEEITLTCSESDRLETLDFLTNMNYTPDPDLQIRSNESYIIARRSILVKFPIEKCVGDTAIDASMMLVKQNYKPFYIKEYDLFKPKVMDSNITEYEKMVLFQTNSIGEELIVYINKCQNKYDAIGWTNDTFDINTITF